MLNRTNRTLSANLNGLNLGTRSLAVSANINTGDLQTLRTRHEHHVVMRDGMDGSHSVSISSSYASSISIPNGVSPLIPGSLPVPSWLLSSLSVRPWSVLAAEMFAAADRPPCWQGEFQSFSPERVLESQKRSKRDRRPVPVKLEGTGTGRVSRVEKRLGSVSARAARATGAARQLLAASGG